MPVIRQTLKCYNAGMKVIFFDRDGTLVIDPPDLRVDSIDKVSLFPDTLQALKLLADNDYSVVIITNQAGIAEGLLDEAKFWEIQNKVIDLLKPSGIKVLKTYFDAGEIAGGTTFTSVFRPGQVLFGKRRAYQRKVAVADFSGVCSGDIYVYIIISY